MFEGELLELEALIEVLTFVNSQSLVENVVFVWLGCALVGRRVVVYLLGDLCKSYFLFDGPCVLFAHPLSPLIDAAGVDTRDESDPHFALLFLFNKANVAREGSSLTDAHPLERNQGEVLGLVTLVHIRHLFLRHKHVLIQDLSLIHI